MWIFLALISAMAAASRRPFEKKVINEIHHFTYGLILQLVSLPILITIVVFSGKMLNPFNLGLKYWAPLLLISIIFPTINTILYAHAVKRGELSKVLPLQSLSPVFVLIIGWLILGEMPRIIALIGLMITVFGVYALGLKGKRLHHPFQPFREDSSSRAMLTSVLLVSTLGVFEKLAVQASNPLFYSLSSCTGAIITLIVAMMVTKQRVSFSMRSLARQMTIIGTLQSISYVSHLLAISVGVIAYVSAIRSTNILMGSVLGIIVFKEKMTKPKLVSLLLIIIGSLCLALGS